MAVYIQQEPTVSDGNSSLETHRILVNHLRIYIFAKSDGTNMRV
jgi:hypothetical protein